MYRQIQPGHTSLTPLQLNVPLPLNSVSHPFPSTYIHNSLLPHFIRADQVAYPVVSSSRHASHERGHAHLGMKINLHTWSCRSQLRRLLKVKQKHHCLSFLIKTSWFRELSSTTTARSVTQLPWRGPGQPGCLVLPQPGWSGTPKRKLSSSLPKSRDRPRMVLLSNNSTMNR